MPERNIPARIRTKLRREINWGCPIADCGNPFLTYHHFAPPFREFTEDMEHNSDGMIALCLSHAAQADGGVYTPDQLRALKRDPFLKGEQVRGRNQWLRRNTVLRSGSNTFINIATLLMLNGVKVIWFSRDSEGYLELSMNIRDSRGNPLFVMENNDWLVSGPLDDLQARPRGRDIVIKSQSEGFWITLRFDDLKKDTLRSEIEDRAVDRERERVAEQSAIYEQLGSRSPAAARFFPNKVIDDELAIRQQSWAPIQRTVTEWPALEITLEGYLPPPIRMFSSSKEMKIQGLTMTGSIAIGVSTVFDIRSSDPRSST